MTEMLTKANAGHGFGRNPLLRWSGTRQAGVIGNGCGRSSYFPPNQEPATAPRNATIAIAMGSHHRLSFCCSNALSCKPTATVISAVISSDLSGLLVIPVRSSDDSASNSSRPISIERRGSYLLGSCRLQTNDAFLSKGFIRKNSGCSVKTLPQCSPSCGALLILSAHFSKLSL